MHGDVHLLFLQIVYHIFVQKTRLVLNELRRIMWIGRARPHASTDWIWICKKRRSRRPARIVFLDKRYWKTDKQFVLQGDFARGKIEEERYTLSFVVEKTNGWVVFNYGAIDGVYVVCYSNNARWWMIMKMHNRYDGDNYHSRLNA